MLRVTAGSPPSMSDGWGPSSEAPAAFPEVPEPWTLRVVPAGVAAAPRGRIPQPQADRNRMILRIASLALALLFPVARAQTTWYVDAAGTPPGSGTQNDPFTSIQTAIDQSAQDDLVLVAPGVYVGRLDYDGWGITIESLGGPEVTFIEPDEPGHVIHLRKGDPVLRGFTVRGGYGPPGGDGVKVHNDVGEGLIERCVFTGNRRGINWGSSSNEGRILNCTLVGNEQEGLWIPAGGVGMENTIIWGNGAPPVMSFCCHASFVSGFYFNILEEDPEDWEGLCTGTSYSNVCGNFDADPLFWDPASGDYRLRPGSPAIDTGNPASPLDPDGSVADLGAYVYDPAYAAPPSVYCTSKVNSQGCTPAIGATGTSASLSGGSFDVTCSDVVNNKSGLYFYGYTPKASPYQGGWLCVQSPVKRTQVQDSGGNPPPDDCSGLYTFDFAGHLQGGTDPGLVAGALVYSQYWYRDPAEVGPFTTGRSDALSFGIAP